MAVNLETYQSIHKELSQKKVILVAVSKTKPVEDIEVLYDTGHKDFGENYVQELLDKEAKLPKDIRWHFIGHLQSNKVKYIAPFVYLIHGVDSYKLLTEINKQAAKNGRVISCLLQVHIAREETKFGFDEVELDEALKRLEQEQLNNVQVKGLMGMASFTENRALVEKEFRDLHSIFVKHAEKYAFEILSMGMSGDYEMAIAEGSTMVRIGSLLFGTRPAKM